MLRPALTPVSLAAMFVAAMLVPAASHAQVLPFVDYYGTNVAANATPASNAAINLLKGYSQLWTTGATWNTGSPTLIGQAVMDASQAYVVQVTTNRTAAQAEYAYLTDRRHQSYSAIDGLGSMAGAFRSASGSFTTITSMSPDALTGKFDEKGNGAGLGTSASVGKIVSLVGTLRGGKSSSNPAKDYFKSPRPWRLTDTNAVVQTGSEATGYFTSTIASSGLPDTTKPLTFFPDYTSSVVVVPELLAVRSTTPATDGGFVSGHTNAAYLAGIALGYAMPGSFQSSLLNASEMGHSRIVAGMHSSLDVIGGRMLATALSGGILLDPANATLKAEALAQGKSFVAANGASPGRLDAVKGAALASNQANKDLYTFRMTYGLPTTGATNVAAVVPKGAEVLLETRHSYLTAEQRREVLRTTAIASGHALLDDEEGWGRLNLYAAADGYGRFDTDVTVVMDAAKGGFDARDAWRNDIAGSGKLTKQGTGELALSGNNSFTGGVSVEGGSLIAASNTALGSGGVLVGDGASLVSYANDLQLGSYSQLSGGKLEVVFDSEHAGRMHVAGNASFAGILQLTFMDGYMPAADSFLLIATLGGYSGQFGSLAVNGLSSGYQAFVSYAANGVSLNIAAVPEPGTYAMLLAGLGIMGALARRRRS